MAQQRLDKQRFMDDDERTALLVKSFRESLESQRRRRRRCLVGLGLAVSSGVVGLFGALTKRGATNETTTMSSSESETSHSPNAAYYWEPIGRHYYRGDVVRGACAKNDDDGEFMPRCPPHDEAAWCARPERTGPGTYFHDVCSSSCADETKAWAMVCAWQAVANLESVCAGTFEPVAPGSSRNAPNARWVPDQGVTSAGATLYGCDEHAVCYSCFYGGGATALGGEMCERVAAHYGGFGRLDGAEEYFGYTGAEAAFEALSELPKWCASFDQTKELTQRRDFGFVPAWVNGFGGSDGLSGEYVQRWGHVGGESVEEHVVRDVHKHQERFAQDSYAYWRYILEADSEYDLETPPSSSSSSSSSSQPKLDVTTHVHTSASSLEKALKQGRVSRGALLFVDVLYAMLDVKHFPGEESTENSLAALGWPDEDTDDKKEKTNDDDDGDEDASSDNSNNEKEEEEEDRGEEVTSSSDVFLSSRGEDAEALESLKKSCFEPKAASFCRHRVNKECVYQFSEDLVLRSTTLRAILAYDKPLTVVVGGDLACRLLKDLPVTHHKLLVANDGGLVSSVEAYNSRVGAHAPRASWFPFGLEGVRVLSDPSASALDADSSGARLDQWPASLGPKSLSSKRFFLSVGASLNRRKPSRSTMFDWLVTQHGYDTLEAMRLTAKTASGRLPNSVQLTDNRPPFGAAGKTSLLGAAPLSDDAEMLRRSLFTLAPAGDFWTSGRIIEAMMLGSIPVVDASYNSQDGDLSTKGCEDPAKFWRSGDEEFPLKAPFVFVDRWQDLPRLLEPFANNETMLTKRLADLRDYRVALETHLKTLPLALKRHLDDADKNAAANAFLRGTSVSPRLYSTCDTTPWSDADRSRILDDARAYYSNPDWLTNYDDSPGAPGIGCSKYSEIRDMFPELGAACFDEACVPSLVKDFSCRFQERAASS